VGLAPSVIRPLPASFSLLAVDARSTCTHHSGARFARASPPAYASTRNSRYPRRFAANRAFHRPPHRTCTPPTFSKRRNDARTRDKAVQVSLYGFGQRENPICERPRHLAMAITSSNFVSALLRLFRSACTARHPRFCAASFSQLARRRCHRRVRIIRVGTTNVQEAGTTNGRLSTRNFRSPRSSPRIHAIHRQRRRANPARLPSDLGPNRRAAHRRNATRPPGFPQSASISTRIDLRVPSLICICQDSVELRVGVSFKCSSACTALHRFCAGELLVARPSLLPPT